MTNPSNRGPGRPPLVEGETTISQGVRLSPRDWALAKRVALATGSRSISAGIRAIMAFYRQHHQKQEG
jgi:hypothetical protein